VNSRLVQYPAGICKFPLVEPAPGTRKSQVQEFLGFHKGPVIKDVWTDNGYEAAQPAQAVGGGRAHQSRCLAALPKLSFKMKPKLKFTYSRHSLQKSLGRPVYAPHSGSHRKQRIRNAHSAIVSLLRTIIDSEIRECAFYMPNLSKECGLLRGH